MRLSVIKAIKSEVSLLLVIILLSLIFHFIHYPQYLNFSRDQALSLSTTLNIAKEKTLILVGPPVIFSLFSVGMSFVLFIGFRLLTNTNCALIITSIFLKINNYYNLYLLVRATP